MRRMTGRRFRNTPNDPKLSHGANNCKREFAANFGDSFSFRKNSFRSRPQMQNFRASMFHVQNISAFDTPALIPYRTMRRSAEHAALGVFIAEGEKVTRRLLESHFAVVSVLLTEEKFAELRPLLDARAEEFSVFVAPKELIESLVGFDLFQGVLSIGKIPSKISLAEILKKKSRPLLLAAVDGLANAENLGLLVRNCAAFGAHALLVGETCASPFLRRAVRNSMGSIFQLPVIESDNLAGALDALRAQKVHCVAAHPHTEKSLAQANFKNDCCIIFGSEGNGISAKVLAACDEAAAIPMAAKIDSLNVAAAAAVFLYEANRQRIKNI
jgi:tRNA G18 (ribose-2'-O)-methylase SpoU